MKSELCSAHKQLEGVRERKENRKGGKREKERMREGRKWEREKEWNHSIPICFCHVFSMCCTAVAGSISEGNAPVVEGTEMNWN